MLQEAELHEAFDQVRPVQQQDVRNGTVRTAVAENGRRLGFHSRLHVGVAQQPGELQPGLLRDTFACLQRVTSLA